MKRLFILVAVLITPLIAGAGFFSKDTPPDTFMKLEVGVLRQYGKTSGYGYTLKELVDVLKKTEGKEEWTKENDKQWVYKLTIKDAATGTKSKMTFVFKEDGKYASVVRYIDNDKEFKSEFVGSATDQILIPIGQQIKSKK